MKTHVKIPMVDVLSIMSKRVVSPNLDVDGLIKVVLGPHGEYGEPGHFEQTVEKLRQDFPKLAEFADKISFTLDTVPAERIDSFAKRFAKEARAQFPETLRVELAEPLPVSALLHKLDLWLRPRPAAAPVQQSDAPATRPASDQSTAMKAKAGNSYGSH